MAARRGPKRARMMKMSVEQVGGHLINALRAVYHYQCQFRDDPSQHTAALLAVYLYIDEMREQIYEDFANACEDEEMDPEVVLERLPPPMWQAVRDFFEEHIVHTEEPAASPFVFHQSGYGSA